jgi:methylated-DNA-[protein]-cysteine S-methyltransferase
MSARVIVDSAVGPWAVEGDSYGIDRIYLVSLALTKSPEAPSALLRAAARQLTQYFAGRRREFDMDLHLVGTPFQQSVWSHLGEIDFGTVRTYGDVAIGIEHPHAYRAVGNANSKNPWAIVVPCHRVVARHGIGGYGGRLDVKRFLLRLEGVTQYG